MGPLQLIISSADQAQFLFKTHLTAPVNIDEYYSKRVWTSFRKLWRKAIGLDMVANFSYTDTQGIAKATVTLNSLYNPAVTMGQSVMNQFTDNLPEIYRQFLYFADLLVLKGDSSPSLGDPKTSKIYEDLEKRFL